MAKECDNRMYGLVCRERFDRMESMQEETLRILRGVDSEPGLVDDVRGLKKANKRIWAGGVFILCAFVLEIVRAAWGWIERIVR